MSAGAVSGTTRRATTLALSAFALYGGWAFFANHEHGIGVALSSAFAQGGMSLAATGVSAVLLERLFRIGGSLPFRAAFAAVGTQVIVVSTMSAIHTLLGTPEILKTLAPVAIIGFFYFTSYALWLARTERQRGIRLTNAEEGENGDAASSHLSRPRAARSDSLQ